MFIAGIDPGLNKTGIGILQLEAKKLVYKDHFLINASLLKSPLKKLSFIVTELNKYIKAYPVRHAAVEDIFYAKNIKSAILLGQARGAIIACLAVAQIDIYEYTALQIKKSVVGYGKADKEQVKKLVFLHLGIKDNPDIILDCTDALACAICLGYNLMSKGY